MRATDLTERVTINDDSRWLNPSANATMVVAAHRMTGLPLVLFTVLIDDSSEPCHCALLLPSGKWLDTEGVHHVSEASSVRQCDPECDGYDIDMIPASEEDLNRAFGVQFGAMWEAHVYMKHTPHIRHAIEQFGGDFRYHFD